jgi:transposase-like protein
LEDRIMAWRVESVMDQRLCFIAACLRADEPMNGLCLRFGISRKTGYKWLSRYRDFGAAGLVALSSARQSQGPDRLIVLPADGLARRCCSGISPAQPRSAPELAVLLTSQIDTTNYA